MNKGVNVKLGLPYKIIMIVLVLVFIVMGITMINELRDAGPYRGSNFSSVEFRLANKDYYNINEWFARKSAFFDSFSGKEENLGAVGKYYEQALPYYALKASGVSRASDYYERMEEYKGQMGEYENQADIIDEMLGGIN
ncbi:MAG: hypothetical protein J6U15_06235 [Lachnospiraceae bacterium]|nr:hypothetical protein [Lachnospiraceae bacterium]